MYPEPILRVLTDSFNCTSNQLNDAFFCKFLFNLEQACPGLSLEGSHCVSALGSLQTLTETQQGVEVFFM